jgi:hypothetical protein
MSGSSVDWGATIGWLAVVASVYGGFLLSGVLRRAGKGRLAVSVPVWVFAPTALLFEWLGSGISKQDAMLIAGFAIFLSVITWAQMRRDLT